MCGVASNFNIEKGTVYASERVASVSLKAMADSICRLSCTYHCAFMGESFPTPSYSTARIPTAHLHECGGVHCLHPETPNRCSQASPFLGCRKRSCATMHSQPPQAKKSGVRDITLAPQSLQGDLFSRGRRTTESRSYSLGTGVLLSLSQRPPLFVIWSVHLLRLNGETKRIGKDRRELPRWLFKLFA